MKQKYWAGLIVVIVICILCMAVLLRPRGSQVIDQARTAVENAVPAANGIYISPVDFAALRSVNEDIYAWLYIPGTEINQPVLQRSEDSSYYLIHDSSGRKDQGGAVFTESAYNHKDFSDPAAVIYAKNDLFGSLQTSYSSLAGVEEYDEIIIYLPEKEIRYQVFAATPFRGYHLLYYFHFGSAEHRQKFFRLAGSIKAVDANWNKEITVGMDDQLLILSTPRRGDQSNCYLILAKRIQDRNF